MAEGSNSFEVSPGGGDPYEQLLAQVRAAAEGEYTILGEMGRSKSGNVVYLAREITTEHLVAMKLSRLGGEEFSLEVVKTLDGTVPGLESKCPECKAVLPDLDRFCIKCGADLTGVGVSPGADDAAQMLEAVKAATAGEYEIVGKMDRSDGGAVYFARDLTRDKLVALRLRQEASGDPGQVAYSIGETNVFRPLAAELGATQVAPASFQFEAKPPAAAAPPSRPSQAVPAPSGARPARRVPTRLIGGVIGALVLVVVAYFAFQGGDEATPVATEPVVVVPPSTPAPAPEAPVSEPAPPPAPPPLETVGADSGLVAMGIPLPPGSRLTIDGRLMRGTSMRVPVGVRSVVLNAPGFEPFKGRIAVKVGQTVAWRPTLTKLEQTPASPPAAVPGPPPPAPTNTALNCAKAAARTDWSAAAGLCQKEAEGGDVAAQRTLAMMYDEGRGMGQDKALAVTWYTRAALAGDHRANERLGYMYRDGAGIKRDEKQSAQFFKRAADAGLNLSALEYGVALDEGRGVSQNDAEAATYYRRAAESGSVQAARRLGRLYERGDGVGKSEAEAAKFYRQAADKGDRDGQYYLGRLYKDGKGVEKSAALALEWFEKAAAQGHKEAADEVRKLSKN